jgi:threonine dehydrogenase-like Zn-dependent dehydrogenase
MPIPRTMSATVLHAADDMRVEEWPVPELGPGEVLLKVNVASICGTDLKVLHRTLQGQPADKFIMGHEYAGTVAALGPGVNEFQIGERVAVEVHKGCDRCENCIKGWYTSCLNYGDLAKGHRAKGLTCDGGFAEYAVNHINTLYRLPDNLAFEQACMVTTAASPLWAIDLMGGYVAGETVLVLENVKRGGRIGVVAWYTGPVQMDMNLAVRSNVRIYAARGEGGMNCGRSLALMSAGKIAADPIITHHFTLDQIHEAFRTYVERIDNALKVVIHI